MKTNPAHSTALAVVFLLLHRGAATRAQVTPPPSAEARIARLEKMLAASPGNPGIMYRLAVVEAGTGRHADAIRWLEKAAAAGYDFDPAKEPAFAPLKKFEAFQELSRKMTKPPTQTSTLAFQLRGAGPDSGRHRVGPGRKELLRRQPLQEEDRARRARWSAARVHRLRAGRPLDRARHVGRREAAHPLGQLRRRQPRRRRERLLRPLRLRPRIRPADREAVASGASGQAPLQRPRGDTGRRRVPDGQRGRRRLAPPPGRLVARGLPARPERSTTPTASPWTRTRSGSTSRTSTGASRSSTSTRSASAPSNILGASRSTRSTGSTSSREASSPSRTARRWSASSSSRSTSPESA